MGGGGDAPSVPAWDLAVLVGAALLISTVVISVWTQPITIEVEDSEEVMTFHTGVSDASVNFEVQYASECYGEVPGGFEHCSLVLVHLIPHDGDTIWDGEIGDDAISMILRFSIPPQNKEHRKLILESRLNNIPDPTYGLQLQDLAIQGHNAEGKIKIEYQEIEIKFDDGTIVSLRKPTYSIVNWKYGPPHKQLQISPRVAPPMIGLGLLEAISDMDILYNEDARDHNNDGISGKANKVWNTESKMVSLGRFGWKAGEPNINQQSSKAFNSDIGISAPLTEKPWGDCSLRQKKCRNAPNGNSPSQNNLEISFEAMNKLIFYAKNLGVPARRNIENPKVLFGKKLFYQTGCISCHHPKFITRRLPSNPEQSFQLIWPYSDMLLHDMGEGLADRRSEGLANGREWRTAPLWGIGLTKTVSGHTQFLHDGRARNLIEAILWHGGEAEHIKQKFLKFTSKERNQLLAFLNSL